MNGHNFHFKNNRGKNVDEKKVAQLARKQAEVF